jgi:hypothetical protein
MVSTLQPQFQHAQQNEPAAALKIQSVIRGHLCRVQKRNQLYGRSIGFSVHDLRAAFDEIKCVPKKFDPLHPLSYLQYVRLNKEIPAALLSIEENKELSSIGERFSQLIKEGKWDDLITEYKNYESNPFDEKILMQDFICYARLKGKINFSEFYTAMALHNLIRQYASTIEYDYQYERNGERKACHLPSTNGKISAKLLMDDQGCLTEVGQKYLEGNLITLKRLDRSCAEKVKKEYVDLFKKELILIPKNLRIAFFVENKDFNAGEFWNGILGGHEIFLGLNAIQLNEKNEEEKTVIFSVPSYAVHAVGCYLITPHQMYREVQQDFICLGVVGENELTRLHSILSHPVGCLDPRVKNNLVDPHGHASGAAVLAIHDSLHHAVLASHLSIGFRKICAHFIIPILQQHFESFKSSSSQKSEQLVKFIQNKLDNFLDLEFRYESTSLAQTLYNNIMQQPISCPGGISGYQQFVEGFFQKIQDKIHGVSDADQKLYKATLQDFCNIFRGGFGRKKCLTAVEKEINIKFGSIAASIFFDVADRLKIQDYRVVDGKLIVSKSDGLSSNKLRTEFHMVSNESRSNFAFNVTEEALGFVVEQNYNSAYRLPSSNFYATYSY